MYRNNSNHHLAVKKLALTNNMVLFVLGIALLWFAYLTFEPDPFHISRATPEGSPIKLCDNGQFRVNRHLQVDKHVHITVEPRLVHYLSGYSVMLNTRNYSGVWNGIHTYNESVPSSIIRPGLYRYEQNITYNINALKTVTKKAPTELVYVSCFNDYLTAEATFILSDETLTRDEKIEELLALPLDDPEKSL